MKTLLLAATLLIPQGLVVIPQDHVIPVRSCGMGCQRQMEQLSLPEEIKDGWTRIQVKSGSFVFSPNDAEKPDEEWSWQPFRGRGEIVKKGENESSYWIFAHCEKEKVTTGQSADMSDSHELQDVFYKKNQSGYIKKGDPIIQSVMGAPFLNWGPLCPVKGKKGMEEYRSLGQRLRNALKEMRFH